MKEIENEKNDVEVKVEESNIKIGKYGEEVKKKKALYKKLRKR